MDGGNEDASGSNASPAICPACGGAARPPALTDWDGNEYSHALPMQLLGSIDVNLARRADGAGHAVVEPGTGMPLVTGRTAQKTWDAAQDIAAQLGRRRVQAVIDGGAAADTASTMKGFGADGPGGGWIAPGRNSGARVSPDGSDAPPGDIQRAAQDRGDFTPVSDLHSFLHDRAKALSPHSPGPIFGWGDAIKDVPAKIGLIPWSRTNIQSFKDDWVSHYKDVILDAAAQNDIPPELLGGIAHIEAGGNPPGEKAAVYDFRDHYGLGWPHFLGVPDGQTSLGEVAIQPRRAANALGVDWEAMNESQRKQITSSLQDPGQNIYIVAKHVSDLRNIDFPGVDAQHLTPEQISVIGARYNAGPQYPMKSLLRIKPAIEYGDSVNRRWDENAKLLGIDR